MNTINFNQTQDNNSYNKFLWVCTGTSYSLEWIFQPYSRWINSMNKNNYIEFLHQDLLFEMWLLSKYTKWNLSCFSKDIQIQIHLIIINIMEILMDIEFLYWWVDSYVELFIKDLKLIADNLIKIWEKEYIDRLWNELRINYWTYIYTDLILSVILV